MSTHLKRSLFCAMLYQGKGAKWVCKNGAWVKEPATDGGAG